MGERAGRSSGRPLLVAVVLAVIGGFIWWLARPSDDGEDFAVVLDLIEQLDHAEMAIETTFVDFGEQECEALFDADDGIELYPSHYPTSTGPLQMKDIGFRRAYGTARLELFFHEVYDRRLRLGLVLLMRGPAQSMLVALNEQPVETVRFEIPGKLQEEQVALLLPASAQREGRNVLTLAFEHTADIQLINEKGREEIYPTSAFLLSMSIGPGGEEPGRRGPRTPVRPERGDAIVEDVRREAIHLEPGITLRYYLRAPEEGWFELLTGLDREAAGGSSGARFRISVEQEVGGDPRVVELERRSESPGWEYRRIDLAPWAGEIVRVSISVFPLAGRVGSSPAPATGAVLARPRVIGRKEEDRPSIEVPDLGGHPVVLILCDAMRADVMGKSYKGTRLTPNIDRLASDGIVFERAFAQASYTVSSVPSLFSGQYPHTHGVLNVPPQADDPVSRLHEDTLTIARALKKIGYRTGAIISNLNAGSTFGNDVGFDHFRELYDEPDKDAYYDDGVHSRDVAALALEWLEGAPRGQPFFLYVHYFEPHAPYRHEARFEEDVLTPYEGPYRHTKDITPIKNDMIAKGDRPVTEADLLYIRELYYATVRSADEGVGMLLDGLEERGLYDPALILLVADHGESFAEHGIVGHGDQTYTEQTGVPFVVKLPKGSGARPGRRRGIVELVDVLPTVLRLFRIDDSSEQALGRDFSSRLFHEDTLGKDFSYSIALDDREITIRTERYQYLERRILQQSKPPRMLTEARRLYDLSEDPGAERDILDEYPIVGGYLRQQLHQAVYRFISISSQSPGGTLDDETRALLRRLGYLGGQAANPPLRERRDEPPGDQREGSEDEESNGSESHGKDK